MTRMKIHTLIMVLALSAVATGASAQIINGPTLLPPPNVPPPAPPPPVATVPVVPRLADPPPLTHENVEPPPQGPKAQLRRSSFHQRFARCLDEGAGMGLNGTERNRYARSCALQ